MELIDEVNDKNILVDMKNVLIEYQKSGSYPTP